MRIGLNYITTLLPAGAAFMAIALAPRALALPTTAVPAGSPALCAAWSTIRSCRRRPQDGCSAAFSIGVHTADALLYNGIRR